MILEVNIDSRHRGRSRDAIDHPTKDVLAERASTAKHDTIDEP